MVTKGTTAGKGPAPCQEIRHGPDEIGRVGGVNQHTVAPCNTKIRNYGVGLPLLRGGSVTMMGCAMANRLVA